MRIGLISFAYGLFLAANLSFIPTADAHPPLTGFDQTEQKTLITGLAQVTGDFEVGKTKLAQFFEGLVNVRSYEHALKGRPFYSEHWNVIISTRIERSATCDPRMAAQVVHDDTNPLGWIATIFICDTFFKLSDIEQIETLAHELVHVVRGADECSAMLFSYWLRTFAYQPFYFDPHYWEGNQCAFLGEHLPPPFRVIELYPPTR